MHDFKATKRSVSPTPYKHECKMLGQLSRAWRRLFFTSGQACHPSHLLIQQLHAARSSPWVKKVASATNLARQLAHKNSAQTTRMTTRMTTPRPKPVVLAPKHHVNFTGEITGHPGTLTVRATNLKIRLLSSYSSLLWNPP